MDGHSAALLTDLRDEANTRARDNITFHVDLLLGELRVESCWYGVETPTFLAVSKETIGLEPRVLQEVGGGSATKDWEALNHYETLAARLHPFLRDLPHRYAEPIGDDWKIAAVKGFQAYDAGGKLRPALQVLCESRPYDRAMQVYLWTLSQTQQGVRGNALTLLPHVDKNNQVDLVIRLVPITPYNPFAILAAAIGALLRGATSKPSDEFDWIPAPPFDRKIADWQIKLFHLYEDWRQNNPKARNAHRKFCSSIGRDELANELATILKRVKTHLQRLHSGV